jgi:hypothetical protein
MTSIVDLQLKIKSRYMIVILITISLSIFVLSVGKFYKRKKLFGIFGMLFNDSEPIML